MRKSTYALLMLVILVVSPMFFSNCIREPELHLHDGGNITIELPKVDLDFKVYWDYEIGYGVSYDWQAEWYYGWDATDKQLFGELGYTEPTQFILNRWWTGDVPGAHHTRAPYENYIEGTRFAAKYEWGYWDFLIWNDIKTLDGVQSLNFDKSSFDDVVAYTNQTMFAARYNAPRHTRSYYQPELLFSGYKQAELIDEELTDFVYDSIEHVYRKQLSIQLQPVTYIYLTQIILHHNQGRVSGCDGVANLSGMAQSASLTTGIAGDDPVTVHYNSRFKQHCTKNGEDVDIAGGRVVTFGMCGVNPNAVNRAETKVDDGNRHYMDINFQFITGVDSTFIFDVTDQIQKRYKGGVITIELDMDTVRIPRKTGGSGFDASVVDPDSVTYEFPM